MKKNRMFAALSGVFMLLPVWSHAYAQAVDLIGTWQVRSDKDTGATVLKMSQSGDSISGKWEPSKGDPAEIENGKIAGQILTFSFIYNKHHCDATGHLSGDTISLDITGHMWGMSKTVHRTATRMVMN
jgi:hypothetical protein